MILEVYSLESAQCMKDPPSAFTKDVNTIIERFKGRMKFLALLDYFEAYFTGQEKFKRQPDFEGWGTTQVGPYEVEYFPTTGRLRRIGLWDVQYFPSTGRMSNVGPHEIEYFPSTGRLERIGSWEVEYFSTTEHVRRIGPYDVEYY